MKKLLKIACMCSFCLLLTVEAALAQSIAGVWSGEGTAAMGAMSLPLTAAAEFSQDAAFSLKVSLMGQSQKWAGQYALRDETLTLTAPGKEPVNVACQITGDSMRLAGKLDLATYQGVEFQANMTRQRKAASVRILVPEGDKALVKVENVYEAVKGAQLPALTCRTQGVAKVNPKWKSSKAKILSVSARGVIRAQKAGTATITVTLKPDKKTTLTDQVTVRVVTAALKQKKATLYVGGTARKKPAAVALKPVILPADASKAAKTLAWASSDDAVAAVDDQGVVTAMGKGKANITMTNAYGQTALCKVTVK